jgi:hypothetical protein
MIGSTCDQYGAYTAGMNSDFFNKATDVVRVQHYANGAISAEAMVTVSFGCALLQIYKEGSIEIEALRNLRDSVLYTTPEGQEIIRLYYELSPVIAKAMKEDVAFKAQVKGMIDGVLPLIREIVE